jgi:flagellar L-ring protein precursor FlgH
MRIKRQKTNYRTLTLTLLACTALSACGTLDRAANIGKAPDMSPINNPTTQAEYQPVSLPMPAPKNVSMEKNSLWASDRQTFFKDQRAKDVGDIITVLIDIDDSADLENESSRTRSSSENAELPKLLGLEGSLNRLLPEAIDPTNLVDFDSNSNTTGNGTIERDEQIQLKIAGLVTQILPNGNMVINGKQEVLVNFEKRIIRVDGVIRPVDISTQNTISYEQIAEARISYGGEGQMTDVQQPRYGQQLYDVVFPF